MEAHFLQMIKHDKRSFLYVFQTFFPCNPEIVNWELKSQLQDIFWLVR